MLQRKSILLGILVLVITLGASFILASMKEPPRRKEVVEKKPIVLVREINNAHVGLEVSVLGTLEAHEKVEVFAEVSGILEKSDRPFLEGVTYSKGDVMLSIKDDKYRVSLYSARSNLMNQIAGLLPEMKFDFPNSYELWKDYLTAFDVEKTLRPLPRIKDSKEKYFISGKKILQSYYDIKSMEQELVKYTLRAPFNGKITQSNIKPGTLVRSGQKLGEFMNTLSYDLVVGVDLNNLEGIERGSGVRITSDNITGEWEGVVERISPNVDSKTQMVNVYINVRGKELKEGMLLKANIRLNSEVYGIEIPRKILVEKDRVYVVKDSIVDEQRVRIVQYKGDAVIVEGLDEGSLMVLKTVGIKKGMEVEIKRKSQASSSKRVSD